MREASRTPGHNGPEPTTRHKMQITLKIARNGKAPGTLGWLCEHANTIKIGTTKGGNQAAWLLDATGKSIGLLCIRGPWGGSRIECTVRSDGYDDYPLSVDQTFTDAAWAIFQQIQELAMAQMEQGETTDDAAGIRATLNIA